LIISNIKCTENQNENFKKFQIFISSQGICGIFHPRLQYRTYIVNSKRSMKGLLPVEIGDITAQNAQQLRIINTASLPVTYSKNVRAYLTL